MTNSMDDLIDGFLDDMLTPEQHSMLSEWIQADPEHARQFAEVMLLHDRLRNEMVLSNKDSFAIEPAAKFQSIGWSVRTFSLFATAASIGLIGFFFLWNGFGQSSVSAAMRELDRIIEKNVRFGDRTYVISIDEVFAPPRRGKRPHDPDDQRPPKVSLDGAIVHVRSGGQFVLIRKDVNGEPFITGCDGRTSWAVRSDGPVHVSHDLNQFNRDLPGHENAITLTNIHDGLEQLRQTYDVQFFRIGPEEFVGRDDETYQMLVAIKKPNQRGPQRVEIAYESNSGCIQEMRFIQMPFGPDRLNLRMTLVEERPLDSTFFEHHYHHDQNRLIQID